MEDWLIFWETVFLSHIFLGPQVFSHKEHSEPSFSSPVGKSGALLTIYLPKVINV